MNAGNGLNLLLGKYQKRVDARLGLMKNKQFVQRLWQKDTTLFGKEKDGADLPMGWLGLPDRMLEALPAINEFCKEIRNGGFEHVVLLGMGGSSLAPMVFQEVFGHNSNGIKFTVLDTTEPEMIKRTESSVNIPKTLFLVSSKSGTTVEVNAFFEYFFYRVAATKREEAGENFVAITDEGSPLAQLAVRKKFRHTFINFSDVGGRFSALSYFGIVPAALMGINVKEILLRAKAMAISCGPAVPAEENSGVILGTAMAEMALKGCDKLTYIIPEDIRIFGLWLEQLIAESTGKAGKGIMPFNDSERSGAYGKDRFFVKIGFCGEQNDAESMMPSDLVSIRYPFMDIVIKDELDLGREFFRWEIATATAGAILGINPFDQPNVQESKKYTDKLLKAAENMGELPEIAPALEEDGLIYYASGKKENGKLLLEEMLEDAKPGKYLVLQAYLPEDHEINEHLLQMQRTIQKNLKLPVSVQFGPRYLHSTGQYHKGGPNNGYFVQFMCNSSVDISVPGKPYSFGMLKRAQALGDREALLKHKRKVILVDLGGDVTAGLEAFKKVIDTLQPSFGMLKKQASEFNNMKKMPAGERFRKAALPEALVLFQNGNVSDTAEPRQETPESGSGPLLR